MEKQTAIPVLEERKLPEFNAMQRVKRRFFAMRNGDLAQQMAERGARYRINFGLNLPQVSEIARDFLPGGKEHMAVYGGQPPLPEDLDMADFARRLRDNTSTRESMLIAPMLFPVEALSEEEALEWMRSVPTPEVADVLCLKLLRNHPSAARMVGTLLYETSSGDCVLLSSGPESCGLVCYTALRLLLNLLQAGQIGAGEAQKLIDAAGNAGSLLTSSVIHQIREEIKFLGEE